MTFTLRKLVCLGFLLVICAPLQAQQSAKPKPSPARVDDDDVIRINTNVVQVDAIVVDKKGKIVTDLKAEDFEIVEEGKSQTPQYFLFIPLIEQRTEEVAGSATATATAKPLTVEQVKRTFVFLVDWRPRDLQHERCPHRFRAGVGRESRLLPAGLQSRSGIARTST